MDIDKHKMDNIKCRANLDASAVLVSFLLIPVSWDDIKNSKLLPMERYRISRSYHISWHIFH